jgi:hypothetical protein
MTAVAVTENAKVDLRDCKFIGCEGTYGGYGFLSIQLTHRSANFSFSIVNQFD